MKKIVFTACLILGTTTAHAATITNGSFETGDFTGWVANDLSNPFDPLSVSSTGSVTDFDGYLGVNNVIASDGSFALTTGFDGEGPGVISVSQNIGIINAGDFLSFDYRAGWDLINFSSPGNLDRLFEVSIESITGTVLGNFSILTAAIGTDTAGTPNSDTGSLSTSLDLTSFAGIDAQINFLWNVPNDFTGPANAQLDNVSINPSAVPAPAAVWLFGSGLVGLIGIGMRKKSVKLSSNYA